MAQNKQKKEVKDNDSTFLDEFLSPIAGVIAEERLAEKMASGKMLMSKEAFLKQQEMEVINTIKDTKDSLQEIFNLMAQVLKDNLNQLPSHKKEVIQKELEGALADIFGRMENAENFQDILGFSEETVDWIYQVGKHCLEKQQYNEGVSVFCFLTMLNNRASDYWLGLGLSQRYAGDEEVAIYSFAMASLLNEEQPVSRYHSAEIYYNLGEIEDAKFELEKLEQIVEKTKDQTWEPLMIALRNKIQTARKAS